MIHLRPNYSSKNNAGKVFTLSVLWLQLHSSGLSLFYRGSQIMFSSRINALLVFMLLQSNASLHSIYLWTIYLIKISLILLSMLNFSFHFSTPHTIGTGRYPENIKLNRGQLKIQNRWASSCLKLANCLEVFEGLPRGCKKNGTQEKQQNNIHLLLLTAWCKLHFIKDFTLKQLKIKRLKLS